MKTITGLRRSALGMILLSAILLSGAGRAMAGSTLWVNTTSDEDKTDNDLSLTEAMRLASGSMSRSITNGEKSKVQGGSFLRDPLNPTTRWVVNPVNGNVGSSYGDTIRFEDSVGQVEVNSQLPDLGDKDNIDGIHTDNTTKTNLDGNSHSGTAIRVYNSSGNAIKNLIIHDFDSDGVYGSGLRQATLQGLEIYKCSLHGISLTGYNYTSKHNSRDNHIGGTGAGQANQIYNNTKDGINILNDTTIDQYGGLNNIIEGNYIGCRSDLTPSGNGRHGIYLDNAHGNLIGGDTAAAGNVIADNKSDGIHLEGGAANNNEIYSNRLGVYPNTLQVLAGNKVSAIALVNGAGSNYDSFREGNIIGASGKANYIGGTGQYGIYIGNANTVENVIGANYICTNAKGANLGSMTTGIVLAGGTKNNTFDSASQSIICNCQTGIDIRDGSTSGNVIRGCEVGIVNGNHFANTTGIGIENGATTNTITNCTVSGNTGDGIRITGAKTNGNIVTSCIIGLNDSKQSAVANNVGIRIEAGAGNNAIGASGKGNTIAGNASHGVYIKDAATAGNKVVASTIGLYYPAIGNGANGILIENAQLSQIGNATEGGNTIVRNFDGVQLTGASATGNKVYSNIIGLSADLATSASNRASGVSLLAGASGNEIGGSAAGTGNTLAGNVSCGVYISGSATANNKVYRNRIGTNASDSAHVGNGAAGVGIYGGAHNNYIGGFSTVGNVISGNHDLGVDFGASSGNSVSGNMIGTNAAGSAALANRGGGIRICNASANNTIGGSLVKTGNVISGNLAMGVGIYNTGSTGNSIIGNIIGLDAAAGFKIANGTDGVVIQEGAATNSVRLNTISGNKRYGVSINGSGTTGNTLGGNLIGTNASGATGLGNSLVGVIVASGAKSNKLGESGNANVISANFTAGVVITDAGTDSNTVTNCIIGLTPDKSKALSPWQTGVAIVGGARSNVIGADMTYASSLYTPSNTIAGNGAYGVMISDANSSYNTIKGNFIGTNDALSDKLGNGSGGVIVQSGATHTMIGGGGNAFNVIGANRGPGVQFLSKNTAHNTISKNLIGCSPADAQGHFTALGNAGGVRVFSGAAINTVGDSPFAPNTISGNTSYGVQIEDSATSGISLIGNRIGVTPDGLTAMANAGNGVTIKTGANRCYLYYNTIGGNQSHGVELNKTYGNALAINRIGVPSSGSSRTGNSGHGVRIVNGHDNDIGTSTTEANIIANNAKAGVSIVSGYNNKIRCNSIYGNATLGIDLGEDGVTPPGPVNSAGPNTLIPCPTHLGLALVNTNLVLYGFLVNDPGAGYTIDVYATEIAAVGAHAQGKTWIASKVFKYDPGKSGCYFSIPLALTYAGKVITATVTDSRGNTSEFSEAPLHPIQPYNASSGWGRYR